MSQAAILSALASGPKTRAEVAAHAGVPIDKAAFRKLGLAGKVRLVDPLKPRRGRPGVYRLVTQAERAARYLCADGCGTGVSRPGNRCRPCGFRASIGRAIARDPVEDAAGSCAALHDAIHALYARTAARLGCSVEAARLVLLYSPAQIGAMAA